MDGLGDGGQTVGGAGGVGNDAVFGTQILVIDTHDDGDVFVFSRGADDDLVRPATQMLAAGFPVHEFARGFHHHVAAVLRPAPFPCTTPRDAHGMAVYAKACFARLHRSGEAAMDRIVLEQMGQLGVVGLGIDDRQIDIRVAGGQPDQIPADAAKSVDADGDRHSVGPPGKCGVKSRCVRFGHVAHGCAGCPRVRRRRKHSLLQKGSVSMKSVGSLWSRGVGPKRFQGMKPGPAWAFYRGAGPETPPKGSPRRREAHQTPRGVGRYLGNSQESSTSNRGKEGWGSGEPRSMVS